MKNYQKIFKSTEPYSKFLTQFQARVNGVDCNEIDYSFSRVLPGLFQLLNSLSSSAYVDHSKKNPIKEWNPFSQRVFFDSQKNIKNTTLITDFDHSVDLIRRFVILSHEAKHILFWEPFFVGKTKKISVNEFVKLSLCFEGYCFWYADMIVTKKMKAKLPGGEFFETQRSVSQEFFHPYKAFEALGITNKNEILDIYLDGFQGGKTKIFTSHKKAYVRDLFKRFAFFYFGSIKPSRQLYKQLTQMGIFDEFQKRFCAIPNLPSILPEKILTFNFVHSPEDFCRLIHKEGMKSIDKVSNEILLRVRQRRFIQTRAYAAYLLLNALGSKNFISQKEFDVQKIEQNIYIYLNNLELALHMLVKGERLLKIQKHCFKNDRMYSTKIRKTFVDCDLWILKREIILSPLETNDSYLGLLDRKSNVVKKDALVLSQSVLDICFKELFTDKKKIGSPAGLKLAALIEAISDPCFYSTPAKIRKWKSTMNKLLLDPVVIKLWSYPYSAIDPEKDRFCDLTFKYE